MHRNHPQTQLSGSSCHRRIAGNSPGLPEATVTGPIDCLKTVLEILVFSATQHDRCKWPRHQPLARSIKDPSDRIVHRASEPSPSDRWGATRYPNAEHSSRRTTIPGQTSRPNSGSVVSGQSSVISQKTAHVKQTHKPQTHAPRDAPEPDSH